MSLNSGEETSRGRASVMRLITLDAAGPRRHDDHAIGEQDRLLDRVRDKDHGELGAGPKLQQFLLQPFARHGIERPERLVHKDDLRIVGEHTRDGHALAHAARKLVRIGIREFGQADHLDEVLVIS